MPKKPKRYYQEHDSPFFRLRSKAKLASLLFVSPTTLQILVRERDLYYDFKKPKASGGFREISAPRDDLKAVQKRIADLLQRIAPPDYLFAPVAGRSYVNNAAAHLGAHSVRLLDIEDFFPSCTDNKVIWFFRQRMQCPSDVAIVLKSIVTREGSLPQGSPCSPILAYLCYVDMWEEIARIVEDVHCTLSVYADDLTISGETVPEKAIWETKKVLRRHGHRYQRSKERSKHGRPTEITGVILRPDGLHVPNRLHKQLHDVRRTLGRTMSAEHRATLQTKVRGRQAQMHQVASGNTKGPSTSFAARSLPHSTPR